MQHTLATLLKVAGAFVDIERAEAVIDGEKDKLKGYGGLVLPLIFENAGRIGPQSQETLTVLADDDVLVGFTTPGIINFWRAKLNRVLTYISADLAPLAMGWNAKRYCRGGSMGVAAQRSSTSSNGLIVGTHV